MKKTAGIILISLLLGGCSSYKISKVDFWQYQTTYTIQTGSIDSANKYVWTLQSDDTTYLGFKLPGRITNIYVKEWDFVKKWQLLATLDWTEVKTQYASANQILSSLRQMYKNTKKMFDAQIQSMKAKVEQAKAAMEWFKSWVADTKNITKEQLLTAEKQVQQAKVWLETAKTNLEHTKQVLYQTEENLYSNAKNAIANAKILENNFLIFVDKLFGISDKYKNTNLMIFPYLSAKDTSLKEEIKNNWVDINSSYQKYAKSTEKLLVDIKNSSDVVADEDLKQRIYDNLQKSKEILVKSRKLADLVVSALDNSIASSVFPQSMINQYKQQAVSYQQNIEKALLTAQWSYLLGVKGSIQAIDDFKKQKAMKLDLLQKQYELAKTRYETAQQTYKQYQAMSEWKLDEVNTKYEVAKRQYEEALKWLAALEKQESVQLSQIKSQINQVKWNKNLAAVNLGNIKLYAPYDGVITKKMADIWQVVWAWTPVFIIANPKNLKWVFYVPVEEVKNIKVWQKVYIEWLSQVITGYISLIYPSADMLSKKIPVEVKFSKVPSNWKLGMFITGYPVNHTIYGLVIPQSFIRYEYWKPYTYVKQQNKFEKKYLKLWECDNDYCIVLSWLKLWDIVK